MSLRISSVGIPEISPYTKSEQPRIAGKHLTRHAKNGDAAVAIRLGMLYAGDVIASPASAGSPIFGRVGNHCRGRYIKTFTANESFYLVGKVQSGHTQDAFVPVYGNVLGLGR